MNNPCFRNPVDPNGERIDEQVSCENPAGCGTQTTSQRTCTQGNRSEQRFLVKSEGFGTGQTSRVTYNLREENLTVIRSQNSQDRFLVRDRDKGVPTRVDGVAGCGVVFPDNIAACAAPFTVVTVFETRNGTVVKNEGPEPKCSG
jgi:hypothetical protein